MTLIQGVAGVWSDANHSAAAAMSSSGVAWAIAVIRIGSFLFPLLKSFIVWMKYSGCQALDVARLGMPEPVHQMARSARKSLIHSAIGNDARRWGMRAREPVGRGVQILDLRHGVAFAAAFDRQLPLFLLMQRRLIDD